MRGVSTPSCATERDATCPRASTPSHRPVYLWSRLCLLATLYIHSRDASTRPRGHLFNPPSERQRPIATKEWSLRSGRSIPPHNIRRQESQSCSAAIVPTRTARLCDDESLVERVDGNADPSPKTGRTCPDSAANIIWSKPAKGWLQPPPPQLAPKWVETAPT